MAEKHKKGYVATLPTCGPLLILPPAVKRRGSPRRLGLCSHLAHTGHKIASSPAKEACSPQEYRQEGTRRVGG